jgi:hypothetical protein
MSTFDSRTGNLDLAISSDLPGGGPLPGAGPQSVLVTGQRGPLSSLIALPQDGQIWIAYEPPTDPAASIYLWHEGGAAEPINPGWNAFVVNQGDCIQWTLSSPGNIIKIAWEYAE